MILTKGGMLLARRCPALPMSARGQWCSVGAAKPVKGQRTALQVRSAAATPATEPASEAPAQKIGVKASLLEILQPLEQPITSEDLWPLAEAKGLRSKRFMKNMLNDMRRAGKVTSKPARGKYFGYILPENYLALKERVNKSVPTEPNPPISRAAV